MNNHYTQFWLGILVYFWVLQEKLIVNLPATFLLSENSSIIKLEYIIKLQLTNIEVSISD